MNRFEHGCTRSPRRRELTADAERHRLETQRAMFSTACPDRRLLRVWSYVPHFLTRRLRLPYAFASYRCCAVAILPPAGRRLRAALPGNYCAPAARLAGEGARALAWTDRSRFRQRGRTSWKLDVTQGKQSLRAAKNREKVQKQRGRVAVPRCVSLSVAALAVFQLLDLNPVAQSSQSRASARALLVLLLLLVHLAIRAYTADHVGMIKNLSDSSTMIGFEPGSRLEHLERAGGLLGARPDRINLLTSGLRTAGSATTIPPCPARNPGDQPPTSESQSGSIERTCTRRRIALFAAETA